MIISSVNNNFLHRSNGQHLPIYGGVRDCTMTVKDGKSYRRCWRNLILKEGRAPGVDKEVCVCVSASVILPLVVVLFLVLTLSLSLLVSLSLSLFVSLSLSLCGGRERVTVCVSLYSD